MGEFASSSDYIVALIDRARNSHDDIERLLLEGLDSGPASEWKSKEIAGIRERLFERYSDK